MKRLAKCGVTFAAPEGKFRIIGYDSFDNDDWHDGDHDTLEAALKVARDKGGEMTIMHVYNDQGKHMSSAGTF